MISNDDDGDDDNDEEQEPHLESHFLPTLPLPDAL